MSCARGRSRSGCAWTSASSSETSSAWRPSARSASIRSSSDDGAKLLEPRDLRLRERLVEEVGERRPAPERERLAQRALGSAASPPSSAARPSCARRAKRWTSTRSGRARARSPARGSRSTGPERLAELRDVDLHRMRGRLGRIAGPERLDEPVDRDDAPGLEREHSEERARLRPAERDGLAASFGLDRAEETYLELWGACPARSVHVVPSISCARRTFSRSRNFHPALSRS